MQLIKNMELRLLCPIIFLVSVMFSNQTYAETISVNPNETYQTMEGFGGGVVYYQNWLTAHENQQDIYDTIFTALKPQIMRIGNWNQDESSDLKQDSIIVYNAKKRLGNSLKILMTSWSAPASLKVSGDVSGGGRSEDQNTLKKVNGKYVYAEFASWWKRTLKKYKKKGIVPDFISFQNEPDMNAEYEETLFAPTETSTLAGYPEMLNAATDSIRTLLNYPLIFAPEVLGIGYNNFDKYASKLDKSKFDMYAYHLYHGNTNDAKYEDPDGFTSALNVIKNSYSDKPNIMTEFCPMRSYIEKDMVTNAQIIINTLKDANASGYINWELTWGGTDGQMVVVENPWDKSQWTTSKGYIVKPEYHTIRHFSKFIENGWKRVNVATGSLRSVAFKDPSGDKLTVIIVNTQNSAITANINGIGSSMEIKTFCQSIENGAKSVNISVDANETSLSFPARSITTIAYTKGFVDNTPKSLIYTYDGSDYAWENTNNWDLKRTPTDIDTAVIRSGEVQVTSYIECPVVVESNGVYRTIGNYETKEITLAGGTLKVHTSSTEYGMKGPVNVTENSTIWAGSTSSSPFLSDLVFSGNGDLTKTNIGILQLQKSSPNYSGNWYLTQGKISTKAKNVFGTGNVTVSNSCEITVDVSEGLSGCDSLKLENGAVVNLTADYDTVKVLKITDTVVPAGIYTTSEYPDYIKGDGKIVVLTGVTPIDPVEPDTVVVDTVTTDTTVIDPVDPDTTVTDTTIIDPVDPDTTITDTTKTDTIATDTTETAIITPIASSISGLKTYPNPANRFIIIEALQKGRFYLLDRRGNYLKELSSGKNRLPKMPTGVYYVLQKNRGKIVGINMIYITDK